MFVWKMSTGRTVENMFRSSGKGSRFRVQGSGLQGLGLWGGLGLQGLGLWGSGLEGLGL